MQVVRTILWVLLALAVAAFIWMNWGDAHTVTIWPGDEARKIVFDWPVGFIAFFFFCVGFLPMWLFHRGVKWRLNRRIKTLENAARAAAVSRPVPAAVETFETAEADEPSSPSPFSDDSISDDSTADNEVRP